MARHFPIWMVAVAIADARLLRPERASLVIKEVADVEQAVKLLDIAPVSCVSYEPSSRSANFSIGLEDVYDPEELLQRGWNATKCRSNGAAGRQERVAMLVPTYPPHQRMYNRLVASVRRNILGPALLISVFSSIQEGEEMTAKCGADCWANVGSASTANLSNPSSRPRLRSMIFNYGWRDLGEDLLQKWNYQAAKKIWALHHCEVENVLVLDSDFAILRPIVLEDAIAPYERVLYEVNLSDPRIGRRPIARNILHANKMLGIRTPRTLHFEQPWIFHRDMIRELVAYVALQSPFRDAVEHFLHLQHSIFEVLLYRRFVLYRSTDPHFFTRVIPTNKVWFEAKDAKEADRLALTPPPIGVRYSLQQKEPCHVCWLEAYADRD